MKISNSKKQLAKIIHENGGWRDGYGFSAQDGDDCAVWFYEDAPVRGSDAWWTTSGLGHCWIEDAAKLPNWHQTILSREEYFRLYPAPNSDGWIEWQGGDCPVGCDVMVVCKVRTGKEFRGGKKIKASILRWRHTGGMADIIAYRLHKPEQAKPEFRESVMSPIPEPESKPTIEQLASDYRNAKDYADRKQQEADAAKADAETKLAELVAAGTALGLVLSVAPVQTYTGKFYNSELGESPAYSRKTCYAVCDGCGKRYGEHYGDRCKSGGEG